MVTNMNRKSLEYLQAVVKKKSQDDPKEIAIRDKIRSSVLQEPWARDAFARIGELQKKYLEDMAAHVDDASFVHEKTQEVLREISQLTRSRIEEGGELLETLPKGSPVLIATNHFGAYKLTGLKPREDLGVDIPDYDAMYPYPMYFAALSPVAEKLGNTLYYASEDFPLVFGEIHSKAGFIHVPPATIEVSGGRTSYLIGETRGLFERRPHAAVVNFPEGGTSGKYSGSGPYDLGPFKTGAYVIAGALDVHVIPVAQYFDPKEGFRLKVFQPIVPPHRAPKEEYEGIAQKDRDEMQTWLNQKKQ